MSALRGARAGDDGRYFLGLCRVAIVGGVCSSKRFFGSWECAVALGCL